MYKGHQFLWRSLLAVLLAAVTGSALPPKITKVQRVTLRKGQTVAVLQGRLKPYTRHLYRFRGNAGQQLSVQLESAEGDAVLWVQSTRPVPGTDSFVLPGITKEGVTEWLGELPASQDYEIYISNPRISDHPVTRVLPYTLRLTVK
jgi:hypothetical protein